VSVRLNADDREVLTYLAGVERASGATVQGAVTVWPVRSTLDRLRRKHLIEHDGERALPYRIWWITDAGREAIA